MSLWFISTKINHLDEMTVEVEINGDYFSGELAELPRSRKKW